MMDDDLKDLDAYSKDRSEQAFARVVQRHVDWVYGMSLRLVRDSATAEDVTQAAFLVLARKAGKVANSGRPIAGWLFRTCRYCAANALHRQRVRHRHERKAAMTRPEVQNGAEPMEHNHAGELKTVLDTAVAKLRRTDREAVVLRFYQGRTMREVGQAMGTSEEAARKRVGRALERLRLRLAGQEGALGADPGAAIASALAGRAPDGLADRAAKIHGAAAAAASAIASGAGWSTAALAKAAVVAIVAVGAAALVVSEVNGSGSKPTTPANAPASNPPGGAAAFSKRFASGAVVEVLCIGRDPKGKNQWWLPDGTPIAKYPFDGQITYPEKPAQKAVPGDGVLVVITRFQSAPGVNTSTSADEITPAPDVYLAHLMPNYPMRIGGRDMNYSPEPNVIGYEKVPQSLKIKMRITGKWEFGAASAGMRAGKLANVLFSEPKVEGKGVKFDVTYDSIDKKVWDLHIVAEMKNGQRRNGIVFAPQPVAKTKGKDRFEAEFPELNLADVKQFVVEMSKWDEADFELATRPNDAVAPVQWRPADGNGPAWRLSTPASPGPSQL